MFGFAVSSVTREQTIGFLDGCNKRRDHKQRIYISYDSTNKNYQTGDVVPIEYGKAKDDKDVSRFIYMVDKVNEYGYQKVGFMLNDGYFSVEENLGTFVTDWDYSIRLWEDGYGQAV